MRLSRIIRTVQLGLKSLLEQVTGQKAGGH
jgi:hypothetical protein